MTRRGAEINNGHPPTFFVELFPFVIFSIEIVSTHNLDSVRDNFTKLGRNVKHDRRRVEINNSCSACILAELFPFVIFPIEIVSTL